MLDAISCEKKGEVGGGGYGLTEKEGKGVHAGNAGKRTP